MADDRPQDGAKDSSEAKPDDISSSPDLGRARRAPPTIDLEASEVSGQTKPEPMAAEQTGPWTHAGPEPDSVQPDAAASASQESEALEPEAAEPVKPSAPISPPISPWVIAPVSGAVAAALVIGVGWMLGWPAIQPATLPPQANTAAIDALGARLSSVEAKTSKPAGPVTDAAAAARIDALEKSIASLRSDLGASRAQSEKLAAAVGAIKSTPSGDVTTAPDLSGINDRLDKLERAQRAEGAAIAQDNAKPADDAPLRRVVVASLLDLSVRQGEPYATTLAAAKALVPDAGALKPLDSFATTGVPTAAGLSRELLTLIPKLTPPAQASGSAGSDLVDRLKAGAERLVRIERTDGVGNDPGAIVARVTAAALRNDANEARRELNTLSSDDRAAAQSWIDKANARDAALAASRQFAADAMAALAKPSQ